MEKYIITEKFTLVPTDCYKSNYLEEIFELNEKEVIESYNLPHFNATLACAIQKNDPNKNNGPLILFLINSLERIKDHNKLIISYNKKLNLLHIVAGEENKLLLANSFKCSHKNTMLYFITLVCQQVMFNPLISGINVYGKLEMEEEMLIKKYFQKITLLK